MRLKEARAALEAEIKTARKALGLERAAPLAAAPLGLFLAWGAAGLFGWIDFAPPLLASLLVLSAMIGVIALAARAALRWRAPSEAEAKARLEADNGLDRGAFSALDDTPTSLNPTALAFWRRAQEKASERAATARARRADLSMQRIDPFYLRYVLALAAAVGLIAAGPKIGDRLARAYVPDPGPLLGDGPLLIEAWAAPARYTGAAPVRLTDKSGQSVRTAPQPEIVVRATGPKGAPKLVFSSWRGRKEIVFQKAADGAWEASLVAPGPGEVKFVRFLTKARWRIDPAPDHKPVAAFAVAPAIKDDKLTFSWKGEDDYGVAEAAILLEPVDPPAGLKGADPLRVEIDAPGGEPKTAEGEAALNLLAHDYAGLKVRVRVETRDALGQTGVSEAAEATLPEKIFLQPAAQAAIEARKHVLREARAYRPTPKDRGAGASLSFYDPVWGTQIVPIATDDQDPRLERAPAGIQRAARLLDGLTQHPQDGYFPDFAVFSGLRLARETIGAARDIEQTRSGADVLWEVALRAEYGDSADARTALEQARKALSEAMRRGGSPDEIKRLTDVMRQAMRNYMEALTQEALRNGRQETQEDTQAQSDLNQRDLDSMMQEVERLNREGRKEEAQALLDQLMALMENMQVRLTSGPGESGDQKKEQELDQALDDLSKAMGEQRALREDSQKGADGDKQQSPMDLARRQGQLQDQLEQARKGAEGAGGQGKGEAHAQGAQDLKDAERAMQRAEKALNQGAWDDATRAQDEALRKMRAGAHAFSQAQNNAREDSNAAQDSGARDPLGRRTGSNSDGESVRTPDSLSKERAREILDELRARLADPNRPESERDYLRRLLEQFTGS